MEAEYLTDDPEILKEHTQLKSQIQKLNKSKEVLLKRKAKFFNLLDEKQRAALAAIEADSLENRPGSNFNPYALEKDHLNQSLAYTVSHHYNTSGFKKDAGLFVEGSVSDSVKGTEAAQRSVVENETYGTAADADTPLDQTGMDPDMVVTLQSLGVLKVSDITNHSAKDYIEKFNMTLPKFEALLDELNVLGIHLHFDANWDRNNGRIRKKRTEFYEYRHVPGGNVKWSDPYLPDDKQN